MLRTLRTFPGRIERAAALSVSTLDLPFSEEAWGWAKARLPGMSISREGTLRFAHPTRWNLKPSSRLTSSSVRRVRSRGSRRGELESAAAPTGEPVMWQKIGYCRQKAAECAARAQEA